MRIRLIVGQYKESYPGEYMPNVLDAWDEYTLDENHEGFEEKLRKYEGWVESGDIEAVRLLDVEIPDDAVLDLFKVPTTKGVPAPFKHRAE